MNEKVEGNNMAMGKGKGDNWQWRGGGRKK
jgi:hypothetical protein